MIKQFAGLAALAILACLPGTAQAEWREYETRHFLIYSDRPEAEVTKRADRLEAIDGLMRMATKLGDDVDPVKVRIYVVDTDEDVEKALGLTDSGVAGFYTSNILGPFAVTPRKTTFHQRDFTPELVLHHEYAHHFMLQYFPGVYPPWYVEGFAELVGSSKILDDGKVAYGMPAKHRGENILANWIPLQEVLRKPAHRLFQFDLYAQGWAMTHFLTFDKERSPQLRQYLTDLTRGKPVEEAARAFGDLGKLNKEARSYVSQGSFTYIPVPVPIAAPVIQKSRSISAGEAAVIAETIAFQDDDLLAYRKPGARERERKRREENLARIREKARRFPDDAAVHHLLAEAEYGGGHLAEAEAAADRLLTLRPDHVRGMVRKSILLAHSAEKLSGQARKARASEARRLAVRANKADPDDPLPLFAFYQSFNLAGETPTPDAVDGLRAAVRTLPGDTTVRLLLVERLAKQKNWGEAIAALTPIANSPHPSPLRDAAQEQLAKLRAAFEQEGGAKS